MNYSAPEITSTMAALVFSQSEQSSSNATNKNNEDKKGSLKMHVDDQISFAVTQPAKKSQGRPRKQNTQ